MEVLTIVSALSAAAAAVAAALQLGRAAEIQKRTATFDHLRQIDERLEAVWRIDVEAVVEELLSAYRGDHAEPLSDGAAAYLSLLNALDLLALELSAGAVQSAIAEDYLRSICQESFIRSDLINAIQQAWKDDKIYGSLLPYLERFRSSSTPPLDRQRGGRAKPSHRAQERRTFPPPPPPKRRKDGEDA